MTINERIRALRKDYLKMNQTEFASLIGMKQTSVSSFEKPCATVTDQTIKSICLAVDRLNEDWLRSGTGEMFVALSEEDEYSRYASQLSSDPLFVSATIVYGKSSPEFKESLLDFFREVSANMDKQADAATIEPTVEQLEKE